MSQAVQGVDMETKVRTNLGRALFTLRWIMAPFYLGLFGALLLVAVKFVQKLVDAVPVLLNEPSNDTIFTVLSLIDLALVANLLVIVMFAGWETFIGRLLIGDGDQQPNWLGTLNFDSVKLKLIASIMAIGSVVMLETFVHIEKTAKQDAAWQLAILLGLGVIGLMLALMDRLSKKE